MRVKPSDPGRLQKVLYGVLQGSVLFIR